MFAAVEVSRRVFVRRPAVLYLALLAALIVAWAVPPSSLLGLSPLLRFVVAVVIAFAPIFLANMVSLSASAAPGTLARPSAPTCSARWWAASWSTPR